MTDGASPRGAVRSGPAVSVVGRQRRRVEERRRVAAAEVHGRLGGGRWGDEARGEVAVAGVVALGAGAVALVEVERVAERVVVELAAAEVVVRPRGRAAAAEPPDEGLPPRAGHQLRPLAHLEHRVHRALPPGLLLRRGAAAYPLVGGGGGGPGEAAAPAAPAREEGRLRLVHARGVGVHRPPEGRVARTRKTLPSCVGWLRGRGARRLEFSGGSFWGLLASWAAPCAGGRTGVVFIGRRFRRGREWSQRLARLADVGLEPRARGPRNVRKPAALTFSLPTDGAGE